MIKKIYKHLKNHTLIAAIKRKYYIFAHFKLNLYSDEKYLIKLGKTSLKYKMDLKNPKTFNEKLNYYKLHYENALMADCVEKIKAKQYVIDKGLEEIVIKTIATYDSLDEVNLDDLPNSFVIKNTIDSGGVFVCKDKKMTNKKIIQDKLSGNFKYEIINGKHYSLENSYTQNKNRIIVEELIETEDNRAPWDYKIFCFNGEPKFLFVAKDRETECTFDFFDTDFNWIDVRQGHPNAKVRPEKPENFDKMLEYARILSKGFPQVRVDLYNIKGKIYFGELTFYHFAGLTPFEPKEFDEKFGTYFDIESLKN